jgi:hypothetical protein
VQEELTLERFKQAQPSAQTKPTVSASASLDPKPLPVAPTTTSNTPKQDTNTDDLLEQMRKRAERFGVVVSSQLEELEKKKRAERFGGVASTQIEESAKQKRADRFGTSGISNVSASPALSEEEERKKRLRAERFGVKTG